VRKGTRAARGSGPWLLDAHQLTLDPELASELVAEHGQLRFLFVEHYVSLRAEQAALATLEEVSALEPQRVQFFVGLDEPLLQAFDGHQIVDLMKQLGMCPYDVIEHPLVNRAIMRAQTKLAKYTTTLQPVTSDAEWFKLKGFGD
jgi:hypothetical protein